MSRQTSLFGAPQPNPRLAKAETAYACARPSAEQVKAHMDHVRAAILGIEDANRVRLEREQAGKRTDGMAPFRQIRLNGFRDLMDTLEWLHAKLEASPLMRRPEQDFQIAAVKGLRAALPHGWLIHHSANAPRSKIAGGIHKAMGALKGFPDLIVIGPDATYFLEFKAPAGRLSPEQSAVRDSLLDLGKPYGLVRSWDDLARFAKMHNWPWRVAA